MPDLNIEYMRQCRQLTTVDIPGSGGKTHTLYRHRGEWECSCKSFEFRKTCKHVKQAEAEACQWHQLAGPDLVETPEGMTCPECGGPTDVVKVAV